MARGSYAYGVDVRRFRWLNDSMMAQTIMRALELRWDGVAEDLMRGELQVPEGAVTLPFLQEIVRITELLRLTLPTVRLVAPAARGRWPLVTLLGNARNSDEWLILDIPALAALSPTERAFLLGQALGHIQCGHTPLFMAHFVSHREGAGHLPLRLFLRPWSRLCAFSADRAGLLAAGEFDPALRMLKLAAREPPPWFPPLAELSERQRALEEFERTRIVARVRSNQRFTQEHPSVPELVDQLMQQEPPEALPEGQAPAAPTAVDPPTAPGYEVPADAWPLARCDQRLTRRLGIL